MIRLRGLNQKQLKNRSSKHLYCLTGIKPAVMSMSNAALKELAGRGDPQAIAEQNRRDKKGAK